jgi:hypothetical protein
VLHFAESFERLYGIEGCSFYCTPQKFKKNGGDKLGYSKIKLIILFTNCAIIKIKGGIIEIGGGKNVKCT